MLVRIRNIIKFIKIII